MLTYKQVLQILRTNKKRFNMEAKAMAKAMAIEQLIKEDK